MLGPWMSLLAPPRCAGCDALLAREAVFCGACVATLLPPPSLPSWVAAAFAYGGALADAIRSAKYQGRLDRLRLLGHALTTALPALDLGEVEIVAPAPLHGLRLRERGYDQAAVLAYAVARALGRRCEPELLARTIDTPQLAGLDGKRRASAVSGAFVAKACAGLRVLLVDDVYTTGATLGAARDAIEAAGGRARALVLAATPKD